MTTAGNKSGIAQDISIEQKVAFLKKKDHYPETPTQVEVKKTHMSWVFLTDDVVYKLKIPFQYDHMHLLTIEDRRHNCVEEVRLNKRLAEEVYLGVVPLMISESGEISLGGEGQPIDWLVKMKRLPVNMMLDYWIKTDQKIGEAKLRPIAERLIKFYNQASPISISAREYKQKLKTSLNDYCNEMLSNEFSLSKDTINELRFSLENYLQSNNSIFRNRIVEGKIIEGHGDLKPDHICLSPPVIIDCLEFDRELRVLDVVDDLAFLSIECERLGAGWVGEFFIQYYAEKTGDSTPKELISFYKSYRAVIRALLSVRHIREEQYRGDPKWMKRTHDYLERAANYLA